MGVEVDVGVREGIEVAAGGGVGGGVKVAVGLAVGEDVAVGEGGGVASVIGVGSGRQPVNKSAVRASSSIVGQISLPGNMALFTIHILDLFWFNMP